jgi:hypothetical protein
MTRRSVGDDLTETPDALRALTPAESLLGMAQAVQQFSCNIVKLIEKSDACDARLNQVEATERALAELLLRLARQRVLNHTPVAAAAASELNAIPHDISDIRQTEKQIQSSLQTIDGALAHISNRLSAIEAKISREVGSPPDCQPPPALGVDRLTPAAPVPAELPIKPEQSATPATHEPDSSAPTLLGRAVDPNPSSNDAPDLGPDAARGHKPTASADHLPVYESADDAARSGLKLSVMPDRGGRSELIAAARRAAQAASGDFADEASAIAKIAAGPPARGIGNLHLLIGATAAIVLLLGLLQIAGILVSSSEQTRLIIPTDTAMSLDTAPTAVREPAGIDERTAPQPRSPTPTPPAIFFAESGTMPAPSSKSLVPGWTAEHQPEPTGQASAGAASSVAAATAGLPSASVTAAPSAAGPKPDLATPRPAQ